MKKNRFKYFDLIRELSITGFKLKYQGSFFGYLWSLMKPLFLFLVLYFVFTFIFKLGETIPNYPVYLLLGVVLWGFFVETTSVCISSIVSNGGLIRKIYFPRIILPIAMSLTSLITLILNLFVVFGFALYSHTEINFSLIFLPLLVIEYYLFTLGVSFYLSSLYVKFRDIGPIWEVVAQTLFYGTPILYALSLVPVKLQFLLMLNPIAQIIQDARYSLVTSTADTALDVLGVFAFIPYLIVFVVFISGYLLFTKMSAKFAEEV